MLALPGRLCPVLALPSPHRNVTPSRRTLLQPGAAQIPGRVTAEALEGTVGSEVIWEGSLSVDAVVSQALSAAHIFLSRSDILKNSESRCPLMFVAVLSGTA